MELGKVGLKMMVSVKLKVHVMKWELTKKKKDSGEKKYMPWNGNEQKKVTAKEIKWE